MNEITKGEIRTLEELETAISDIVNNPEIATENDLEKLRNIHLFPLSIHINDIDHTHSISAEMLKVFTDYQEQIYRAVRLAKYGSYNGKLNEEDKMGFSLYVTFKEGSLLGEIDFQAILEMAVQKMNGWQAVGLVAFGILALTIYKGFCKHSDNKMLTKLDYHRMQERIASAKEVESLSKVTETAISGLEKLATETTKTTAQALNCLSKINGSVDINGEQCSRSELVSMARRNMDNFYQEDSTNEETEEIKQKIVSGKFLVSRIDLKLEDKDSSIKRRTVNLVNIQTLEIIKGVPISGKSSLTEEQRDMIMAAVDGNPLEMTMSIAYDEKGEVKNILLLSCNGKSFQEPELF